jgi:hypothetical protein
MQQTRSKLDRRTATSARAAFSLVEVLAALVVTTLLILALTPFVGQMLGTWARGSEVARVVDLKTRGLNRLREDVRHAIVWTGFGQHENLVAFRGNERSMSFPVAVGLGQGRDGLEMLSITVDTSLDGLALVRRRAPLVGSTYTSFVDPIVLFSGPFRYVFRYFTQEGQELTAWANRTQLPTRIELTIADKNGAIFAAPIEIPVFASLSAGCLVSAQLPGCPVQPEEDENAWMKEYGLTPDEK